jgi:hypothetical protein
MLGASGSPAKFVERHRNFHAPPGFKQPRAGPLPPANITSLRPHHTNVKCAGAEE